MAISGPQINASEIQTEFGGVNPIGISEYYKTVGLTTNIPPNAAVPVSGEIKFSEFNGASKFDVLSVSSVNLSNTTTVAWNAGSVAVFTTASISVTSGSGSYSYSWAEIGTPVPEIVISSAGNVSAPTFTMTQNIVHGDSLTKSTTWKVTVTDTITGSVATSQFSVSLTIIKTKRAVSISWSSPALVTSQVPYGQSNSAQSGATVAVVGGRGPFTYSWVYVSGTSFSLTNTGTVSLTAAYSANLTGPADTGIVSGTYKVTVVDTFDGETHTYPTAGGQSITFRLIENASTAGPTVVVNDVFNSKTDPFGTVGNFVTVPASTSITHPAGYAISSYLWTPPAGAVLAISSTTAALPTWTYTNDLTGPATSALIDEIWTLAVTDVYNETNSSTGHVQLQLTESAGAPPSITTGTNPLTASATTNYGSTNITSVSSNAVAVAGDHAISSIAWTKISGAVSFVITNSNVAAATFSYTSNLVGPASWSESGVYRLSVTDVVGQVTTKDYTVNLSHTETITGSNLPVIFAGADHTTTANGPANSGAISVSDEITDATVATGTYSLAASPLKWDLVTSTPVGGFTTDIQTGVWLPNTATNLTPLFSRSADVTPGGSSSQVATYRLSTKDVQGQISTDDVIITLVITESDDLVPDQFNFVAQTGIALGTLTTSNSVTISGISAPVPVILSGDATGKQFSISGGAWVSSGSIGPGQTLQVRGNSSGSVSTTTSVTVTIGGVVSSFNISTIAAYSFVRTISVSQGVYDIRAMAVASGWNQVAPLVAAITVNSGVILTGINNNALMYGGAFVANSSITIINNGILRGAGGNGGDGGSGTSNGFVGGTGFSAIDVSSSGWTITNLGIIEGGSGGGGGGSGWVDVVNQGAETFFHGGDGGNGGYPNGSSGTGGIGFDFNGSPGTGGTLFSPKGVNGTTGAGDAIRGLVGGVGGVLGKAVAYNGNTVSFTNNGTIIGGVG